MSVVYTSKEIRKHTDQVVALLNSSGFGTADLLENEDLDPRAAGAIVITTSTEINALGGISNFLQMAKRAKVSKIIEVDLNSSDFSVQRKLAGKHVVIKAPAKFVNQQILASVIADYALEHTFSYTCGDAKSYELLQLSKRVAQRNVTMLINGPSGSGKEVLARFVHNNSNRRDKSFVAINCAAIPENMLEAVLFGHEKGAFTGASSSNSGIFRAADKGTILLDEISEMPLSLQAKILRVIQEKTVTPIGSSKEIDIDVRIIATTNRDMVKEVATGNFREDLYYRLSVFPISTVPLKDRPDDIIPIATKFIRQYAKDADEDYILTEDAAELLLAYEWPGNVRELENVIQRALVVTNTLYLGAESILLAPATSYGTNNSHMVTNLQVAE